MLELVSRKRGDFMLEPIQSTKDFDKSYLRFMHLNQRYNDWKSYILSMLKKDEISENEAECLKALNIDEVTEEKGLLTIELIKDKIP